MSAIAPPALLLIDVQQGINAAEHWGGNRNNLTAEKNIQVLLDQWRMMNFPVIIVQHDSVSSHSPLSTHQSGNRLMEFVKRQPGERLIKKSATSAFIGTDLKDHLTEHAIRELVITGFVTNNSVEATVRHGGDLGFICTVVSDAIACFDKIGVDGSKYNSELIHAISLSNLAGEYARVLTTANVLATYPDFTLTQTE